MQQKQEHAKCETEYRFTIRNNCTYKWPLLTKGLFSYGEGLSINHHACSMRKSTPTICKWPLLSKDFFSHGEGLSINHHACSRRVGDFKIRPLTAC
uniref:SFRICE_005035 n=1 Tax=Spodoptera frugiperda TaxID=7108 RepID=A0A2H1VMC6_SPOFR